MNTGKELERQVRDLLHLQGWTIQAETQLGHKKVDLLAKKIGDFGKRRTLAVECKDYKRALTKAQVLEIWADYSPLFDNRRVDGTLVISRNGISAAAEAYVNATRGIEHIKYIELQNTLLDFSGYLAGLLATYESSPTSICYQPQRFRADETDSDTTAERFLLNWIASTQSLPVAILGSYGMGKTTLAERTAYILAKNFYEDPTGRIPIVIKLHRIAAEQTLEGLVAKQFTSITLVPNFNYNLFMELNRRGRFVIFLDGFDEMAETMSWRTFKHNMTQLNRLLDGSSKVVIGGRPGAFLSEAEQEEVLHGIRRTAEGTARRIPGWPDFTEIELLPFGREEISTLVPAYAAALFHQNQNEETTQRLQALVATLESESPVGVHLLSLAERPVQLQMLLAVLPTWEEDLEALTTTSLYSYFIDLIIERELTKSTTRHRFKNKERRLFARRLAWWMWQSRMVVAVEAADIPWDLFRDLMRRDEEADDVLRDLLSACFLERRAGGYYFPHKSFQEFLAAEQLVQLVEDGALEDAFNRSPTPAIYNFAVGILKEGRSPRFLKILDGFNKVVPDCLVELLLDAAADKDGPRWIDSQIPWKLALLSLGLTKKIWPLNKDEEESLIRHHILDPAGIHTKNSAKFAIVLACVVRARAIEVLGFSSFMDNVLQLCSTAGTLNWMRLNRYASTREVLTFHLRRDHLVLQSWKGEGEFSPPQEVFGHGDCLFGHGDLPSARTLKEADKRGHAI